MVRKMRQAHGTAHPCARLSEEDIRMIRKQWQEGLADKYGVSVGHINNILKKRGWTYLEDTVEGMGSLIRLLLCLVLLGTSLTGCQRYWQGVERMLGSPTTVEGPRP
jgi:hypothetical protein